MHTVIYMIVDGIAFYIKDALMEEAQNIFGYKSDVTITVRK